MSYNWIINYAIILQAGRKIYIHNWVMINTWETENKLLKVVEGKKDTGKKRNIKVERKKLY